MLDDRCAWVDGDALQDLEPEVDCLLVTFFGHTLGSHIEVMNVHKNQGRPGIAPKLAAHEAESSQLNLPRLRHADHDAALEGNPTPSTSCR